MSASSEARARREETRRDVGREIRRGVALGALLFGVLLALLFFAGSLSSSKFLYVDF